MEPGYEKICFIAYVNSKDSDQLAHPYNLITVFVICCLGVRYNLSSFYTGLRPIYVMFFKFLSISFQMKNNDDVWL